MTNKGDEVYTVGVYLGNFGPVRCRYGTMLDCMFATIESAKQACQRAFYSSKMHRDSDQYRLQWIGGEAHVMFRYSDENQWYHTDQVFKISFHVLQ